MAKSSGVRLRDDLVDTDVDDLFAPPARPPSRPTEQPGPARGDPARGRQTPFAPAQNTIARTRLQVLGAVTREFPDLNPFSQRIIANQKLAELGLPDLDTPLHEETESTRTTDVESLHPLDPLRATGAGFLPQGAQERIVNFRNRFGGGVINTSAAIAAGLAGPVEEVISGGRGTLASELVEGNREMTRRASVARLDGSWDSMLAEGAGTMVPILLAAAVGGTPAGLVAGVLQGTGTGLAAAQDADATLGKKITRTLVGSGLGALEALPVNKVIKRLDGFGGGVVSKFIEKQVARSGLKILQSGGAKAAREILGGAIEEGVQEMVQAIGENAADKVILGIERDLFEGMKEGGAVGAALGLLLNALGVSTRGLRGGRGQTSAQKQPDAQQQRPQEDVQPAAEEGGPGVRPSGQEAGAEQAEEIALIRELGAKAGMPQQEIDEAVNRFLGTDEESDAEPAEQEGEAAAVPTDVVPQATTEQFHLFEEEVGGEAISAAQETGAENAILGPARRYSVHDAETGQPLMAVAAKAVPVGGETVFEVEVRGLDIDGKPLPFEDESFKNDFTSRELLEIAGMLMDSLGADRLVGFRLGRDTGARNITSAQVERIRAKSSTEPEPLTPEEAVAAPAEEAGGAISPFGEGVADVVGVTHREGDSEILLDFDRLTGKVPTSEELRRHLETLGFSVGEASVHRTNILSDIRGTQSAVIVVTDEQGRSSGKEGDRMHQEVFAGASMFGETQFGRRAPFEQRMKAAAELAKRQEGIEELAAPPAPDQATLQDDILAIDNKLAEARQELINSKGNPRREAYFEDVIHDLEVDRQATARGLEEQQTLTPEEAARVEAGLAEAQQQESAAQPKEKPAKPAEKPARTSGRKPDVVPAERQLPKRKMSLRTLIEHVTGQKKTEGRTFGAKTPYEVAQRAAREAQRSERHRGREEMKAAVDKLRETLATERANVKRIRGQQKELRKLVQAHLPLEERGRLLAAIELARTPKAADRAMTRLSEAIEEYEHKTEVTIFRTLVKKIKPQFMRPQFRAKAQEILDTFDDKEMSEATEGRLQAIQDFVEQRAREDTPDAAQDIKDIPFDIREQTKRLQMVGLSTLPAKDIRAINDAMRYWAYWNSKTQVAIRKLKKIRRDKAMKSIAGEVNAQPARVKVSERTGETIRGIETFLKLPFSRVATIVQPERMAEAMSGGDDTVFVKEVFADVMEAYDSMNHGMREDFELIKELIEAAGVSVDQMIAMSTPLAGRVSIVESMRSLAGQASTKSGPRKKRGETRATVAKMPSIKSTNSKHTLTLTPMQKVKLLGYFGDQQLRAQIQRGRSVTIDGFPADARFKFNTAKIRAIEKSASEQERALAAAFSAYYNGQGRARNMAYSVERFGYDNSVEGTYEPALVERLNQEKELQVSLAKASMDNMGITKARINNATAPLRVTDALMGVWNHAIQVNALQAMSQPVANARSLLLTEDVQDAIKNQFGGEYLQYWNNYFDEFARMIGGQFFGKTAADHKVNDLIDKVTMGYLGLNPSAAAKQIVSLGLAANEIPWKHIQQAVTEGSMKGKKGKEIDERMAQYSGYLWSRQSMGALGLVNEASGRSRLPIEGKVPASERMMSLIHGMDRMAIRGIWRAAEIEADTQFKAAEQGSDAYWKAVAAKANKTVRRTQPTADPFTVAPASLSARHNKWQKGLLMFMTQRLKNLNIGYESVSRMARARRVLKDSSSTEGQKQKARALAKKARADLARTVVLNGVGMVLIEEMWRRSIGFLSFGDDEREHKEANFGRSSFGKFAQVTLGQFPYIGPAADVIVAGIDSLAGSKERRFDSGFSPIGSAVVDFGSASKRMISAVDDIFSEDEDFEWWRLASASDRLIQSTMPLVGAPASVYRVAVKVLGIRATIKEQAEKTPAVAARLVSERNKLRKKEKETDDLSGPQRDRLSDLNHWHRIYRREHKKITDALDEGDAAEFKALRREMANVARKYDKR
jgi:hypothetical protein